jgi:thymidylate synthase ThyX
MSFSAKIVADSKNEFGNRLTTFLVTFPRIILAELNTHRMLSKNSASSRAIPFRKMVESVETNPFIPISFQKDHSGMQGIEYFTGWREKVIKVSWIAASKMAIFAAKQLNKLGLTKQLCNRILEPFMWHTVLITASEWQNFFALRAHEAAEIHMQKLAYMMLEEYNKSEPKLLKAGEWHIPYGDDIILPPTIPIDPWYTLEEGVWIRKVKISTARCARSSYTLVGEKGKKHDYEDDIKLHDRLQGPPFHASPFEHCAQCQNNSKYIGNFRGFKQYRKFFENENAIDNRVIIK